jgi:uncharacterized protein YbbK (DUF523 family)
MPPRRRVPSWSNDRVGLPRIGISRCLLGDEVRYDGGHRRDAFLVDTLGRDVEWVAVCPEVEMGMDTPREPIQLVAAADGLHSGQHGVRLVGVNSGRDWTQTMETWRRDRLRDLAAAGLSGYVLKSNSPSCGMDGVHVHADDGPARTGRGLFAQALIDAMPGLPVEDDDRLHDVKVRAAFIDRVFEYQRTHSCLPNHA